MQAMPSSQKAPILWPLLSSNAFLPSPPPPPNSMQGNPEAQFLMQRHDAEADNAKQRFAMHRTAAFSCNPALSPGSLSSVSLDLSDASPFAIATSLAHAGLQGDHTGLGGPTRSHGHGRCGGSAGGPLK